MEIAFGENFSKENWKRVTKSCIFNLLHNIATVIENLDRKPEEIGKLVEFENLEILEEVLKEEKSLIFSSGHLSNWELLATAVTTQIASGYGVVEKMKNPYMEKLLSSSRQRMGITTVPMKGALRKLVKAIRENRNVMILIDQSLNRGYGKEFPFFGKEAIHTETNHFLSKKFDLYIVPTYIRKGEEKHIISFEKPFKASEVENPLQTELEILESKIESDLGNWLWCHRRWKNNKGIYN